MNGVLLVVAYLAGINPARSRLSIPEGDGLRARPGVLLGGSVLAFAAISALAGWSGPILEALKVSPETFRLAAGVVAALSTIIMISRPRPATEPELGGWRAAIWPVAFPRLFTPVAATLALTTGASDGVPGTLLGAAVALVLVNLLGAVPRRELPDRVLLWAGRMTAVALAIVAVFLLVSGIRDV
jgi:small neutral amino acid transporter SnatA (MarC family)